MKYSLLILFVAFFYHGSTCQQGHSKGMSKQQMNSISEQEYLEALSFFDKDEDQPSKELEKAMATVQMYLMKKNDTEGLMNFFEKAADYAKRTGQLVDFINLKSNKAQMLISNGKPLEAIDVIDTLINTYEVEPQLLGRFYKAKGDAYDDLKDKENAEISFLKALSIAQENKDTFHIGISYISLANMNSKLGNVYDAIDYNLKGLSILEKGNNDYIVAGACQVLYNIFWDLHNYEKAWEYARKMDELCQKNGYKQFGAIANSSLGTLYMREKNYDKALEYFNLSMAEYNRDAIRIHNAYSKRSAFVVQKNIARCYIAKNEVNKAKRLLDELETSDYKDLSSESEMSYYQTQIELALHFNDYRTINKFLTRASGLILKKPELKVKKQFAWINKLVAENSNDFQSANQHLVDYYALKDSIEEQQRMQYIHNMEAKYQKAEQEKEISKLSYENERAESQLQQKNVVLVLGAVGLGILSFLVFQFYKLYQSNKQNKEQLASQNIIISKALEDKNTLLKEIHHRVKNNLQVISSLLSLQSRYVKDEETLDAIKAGKSRVQSMSLLHQNLYRDDNLKGVDMKQYFENLGQNLFDTYNIDKNIKLTTDIEDITLDIDTVVPIGLITNELISNALKHAFKGRKEGNIHLSLKQDNGSLLLTVQDDGIGLPDGELPVSYKSLGATLIQSFAEKLEGEIKIDVNNGSKVTVEINDFIRV